ncbi:MAG: O-antigen ligase family protein [Oscillospiraceae bacterium]|nr:O-antigen ligase family protein [Oscillospiraceae bacterium]
MNAAIENCVIARFFRTLSCIWGSSVSKKPADRLSRLFSRSRLWAMLSGLLGSDGRWTGASLLRRFLDSVNAALWRLGRLLLPVWNGCLPVRVLRAIRRSAAVRGSVVLGEVFCPGLRTTIIYLFALYLPIDWALRDVVSWSAAASVWDEAFLFLTALYTICDRMFSSRPRESVTTPLDGAIILFLGVGAALMTVISPRFYIAFQGYRATVQYLLWFFLLVRLFDNRNRVFALYRALIILAVLIALHGIYQFIAAVPIPSHWQTSTEVAVRTRVYSIFGSPNIMGSFMVMFAPMSAALAYSSKQLQFKLAAWACTGVMCFACLFTFSRGAWLGMGVAILIFSVLVDRKLLLLMLIGEACAMCVPDVYNRIAFLFTEQFAEASAAGGRQARWAIGMKLLHEDHPFLGFGLGRYGGAVAMNNKVETRFQYYYLDNYYMRILVEMGYSGLGAYLLMMFSNVFTALRSIFRTFKTDRAAAVMCSGMLSGMAGVLVHCLYENIFEEPYMMAYFWAIAAMTVFFGFLEKNATTRGLSAEGGKKI